MLDAAPLTFGAGLAGHRVTPEEAARYFNVSEKTPTARAPEQPEPSSGDRRVQIGPLDV